MTMLKKRDSCTGCASCAAVCPVNAIEMKPDTEGFLYPLVQTENCIQCRLCEKVCFKEIGCASPIEVFAAQNKDKRVLLKSTSGGIVPALCSAIFSQGGVFYAATYEVERGCRWLKLGSEKEIETIQGSKYLQICLSRDIYNRIIQDLKDGKIVAAIGTPCQVDGIKRAIPVPLQTNLLLIDIICGGVISPRIEALYEANAEKKAGKRLVSRVFRGKQGGKWTPVYYSENHYSDGTAEAFVGGEDLYTRAYTSARLLRESCYRCPFTEIERVGDLTVGDCWGIEKEAFSFPESEKGVSLVLVNTEKGKELLEKAGNIFKIPLENRYPLERNRPLHEHSGRPKMRSIAYMLYKRLPFEAATDIVAYRYMIKRALKGRGIQ